MDIIRGIGQLNTEKKTAIAVGYFDGMHLGHKELIHKMLQYATEHELIPTILTFDMSELRAEGKGRQDLFPREYSIDKAEQMGVALYVEIPFGQIREMSPETFCKTVLADMNGLNAGAVFCGEDFRFGKNRVGSISELSSFGKAMDFAVHIVDEIYLGDEIISTSKIKELMASGQIKRANKMLGEPYSIEGEVVHGNHLAKGMGFPTANILIPADIMIPKNGVYLTETEFDDMRYRSITNVGTRPTVTTDIEATAETHILDFSGDIYGKKIKVRFYEFIRPERKFDSREQLVETVLSNINYAIKSQYSLYDT